MMKWVKDHWPIALGLCLTIVWIAFVFWFLTTFNHWSEIFDLKPNTFGDFAAGVSAPLAFLWLVIAVVLQGRELKLQRAELTLNREVLQLQIEELKSTSEQMRNQTRLLGDEALARKLTEEFDLWRPKIVAQLYAMAEPDRGNNRAVQTNIGMTNLKVAPIHPVASDEMDQNLSGNLKRAIEDMKAVNSYSRENAPSKLVESIPRATLDNLNSLIDGLASLIQEAGAGNNNRIESFISDNFLREFLAAAREHSDLLKFLDASPT